MNSSFSIQVFKDKKGQWRHRLVSGNGRIIQSSEAYSRKEKCMQTVRSIQSFAKYNTIQIVTAIFLFAFLIVCQSPAIAGDSMFVRSDGSIQVIKGAEVRPAVQEIVPAKDNSNIYQEIRKAVTESVRQEMSRNSGLEISTSWEFDESNWCFDDHLGTHIKTKRFC